MRKNIVLIDFESVQPKSLADLMHDHFRLVIFIGANQAKLSVGLAMSIQRLGDRAEYIQISGNGPNALDFHIAFYIGQFAAQDPTAYFHVISKDTGFDPLIHHLKSRKIYAARSPAVCEIPAIKNSAGKSPVERARTYIAKLQEPKVTRPRASKTLASSIRSFFQSQLSDAEVAEIVAAMESEGFIAVAEEKITYVQQAG